DFVLASNLATISSQRFGHFSQSTLTSIDENYPTSFVPSVPAFQQHAGPNIVPYGSQSLPDLPSYTSQQSPLLHLQSVRMANCLHFPTHFCDSSLTQLRSKHQMLGRPNVQIARHLILS